MQDLTLETLIAVLEEIFGRGLFWGMAVAVLLVSLAYVYVLVRDRAISWRKFLLAQLAMPFGAIAAVWFVLLMTDSELRDMGGPVDVIVLFGIAAVGAAGIAVLFYTVQSLVRGERSERR